MTLSKHIKTVDATEMGHVTQRRQGLRSTKKSYAAAAKQLAQIEHQPNPMEMPPQEPSNIKTNEVFMSLIEVDGKLFSDQIGRFPVTSSKGMKYLVILYVYDANAAIAFPIQNRSQEELLRA